MTLAEFAMLLLVAGLCGSVGRALAGDPARGGCLVSIVVGFVGALVGSWLARLAGLSDVLALRIGETAFPVVWAVVGAATFVAVLTLITGGRRHR